MLLFAIVLMVVSLISLCFFKTEFWTKRYHVISYVLVAYFVILTSLNVIRTDVDNTKVIEAKVHKFNNFLVCNGAVDCSMLTRINVSAESYLADSSGTSVTYFITQDSSLSRVYTLYYTNDDNDLVKCKLTPGTYIYPTDGDEYVCSRREVFNSKASSFIPSTSIMRLDSFRCIYIKKEKFYGLPVKLRTKRPF